MNRLLTLFLLLNIVCGALAQKMPGIVVGAPAPHFEAHDQAGKRQALSSLMGPKGLVLLFFRSADWWPYCKQQLVQLQDARDRFQQEGLGLAAISYDSEAILADFAQRHGIAYPLIADPKSEIIQSYGVLNLEAAGFTRGMALPGYFYVTSDGKVKEKFFETAYTDRTTANNLLLKLFPQLVEGAGRAVPAAHIKLTLFQSDKIVVPGSRFTVAAEIELPPDTHVYAPGVKGYKPIELTLEATPELKVQEVRYPQAQVLYLPAIKESVPVFEGKFRVFQDVLVSADRGFVTSLGAGKTLTLKGNLLYQACDRTTCYVPQKLDLSWEMQAMPLDRQRSPEAIRHK